MLRQSQSASYLTESSSHSSLEPISSSARQHFVDADDVERVNAETHVKRVFSHEFHHVLVGANTGGCENIGHGKRECGKRAEGKARSWEGRKEGKGEGNRK